MPLAITPHALGLVRDRETLFAFLHDALGWPLDPADTFTYDEPLLDGTTPHVTVSRLVPFGAGDPFLLLLAEWETPLRRGELREVLRAVRARIRREGAYGGRALDEIIFVCSAEKYQAVWFAHFEEREGRQPRLEAFGWEADRLDSTRTLREVNLPALVLPPLNQKDEPDWTAGYRQWLAAWDVESVTRAFFKDYREVFGGVRDALPPDFTGDRTLWTQRLFNRLLFIHFLSQKREGWLRFGGSKDYLRALWDGRDRAENFYRAHLRPLFFTALNNKHVRSLREDNPTLYALIGDVPYLNGGLFEKADDDDAVLAVPDPALQAVLTLFGRYRFTITESTPDDVEVAVDPEMLGKVFEELVTGRHESGSYYTPRPVVAFMCREALKGYLGGGPPIAALVDGRDAGDLKRSDAAALLRRLAAVRVVDPACGSGAYLLGMLHELYALTGLLELRADPLSAQDQYKRKLGIIQNALYGVDLDPFAVNVARLRLWLSLAVEHTGDIPEPLPNLDFKVEVGDSLASPVTPDDFISDLIRLGQIDDFKAAKDEYGRPDFPGDRKQLNEKIQALKVEIGAWLHQNDKKGKADVSDKSARFFEWQVEFAEVFKAEAPTPGGFDIVLANPPYVRQELITAQKPALKATYPTVYNGTADLYTYFYARAVQLLKPGGMLAFISPNKWFRAGYGKDLRRYLAETCRVDSITDFGELPVFLAAATFPMIFVAQRTDGKVGGAATIFTQVKSLAAPYPDVLALQKRDGHALPPTAISGSDWSLTNTASSDRLRKMEKAGIPLGEYVKGQIFRGVLTGFNKAFVVSSVERAKLIADDPKSAEIIKPLAVGDDVRRWRINSKGEWLIFTRRGIDINAYPAIKKHLAQWRAELTPRKTGLESQGRKPGSYKWYEIQDEVAYYAKLNQPKIVYPEIAKEPRFAFDVSCAYTNNKVFIIPLNDLFLLGILNSKPAWEYAKSVCAVLGDENAGGRLMLQWVNFQRLPIPDASASGKAAVSAFVEHLLYLHQPEVITSEEAPIRDRLMRDYFEQILNGLAHELYFPGEVKIFASLTRTNLSPIIGATAQERLSQIRALFEELYAEAHPLRAALFQMGTLLAKQ